MEVDEIMGDRPITKPPSVMESSDADSKSDCGNSFTDVEESQEQEPGEERCQGINEGENLIDRPTVVECSTPESILTCEEVSKSSQEDQANSERSLLKFMDEVFKKRVCTGSLSLRRGKGIKRTANESFLSNALERLNKQQTLADERFFRLEEEKVN